MSLALDVAWAHLWSRKRQTAASLAGVALGVAFFLAISAMMLGFQLDFIHRIVDSAPHIVVKDEFREPQRQPALIAYPDAAVQLQGLKPRDERRGVRRAREMLAALSEQPGLSAAPVLRTQVFLRYGGREVSASLNGIEPERERKVSNLESDLVSGSLDALTTAANGIILGDGVARKLGAALHDTIAATSPAGVVLRMKIVGISRTNIVSLDDTQAYALLKRAQTLADRPEVINELRIKLADAEEARLTARRIEDRFRYKAESWEESNGNVLGIFVIQRAIMFSTVGAILVVACFGIFNIVSTVVHEKARDIAIIKSIGFREGQIARIFILEGAMLGVMGALLGWALGYGLLEFMGSLRFKMDGFQRADGFILLRAWWQYAAGGVFAVTASTLAAWIPARKAARVDPVDIIRGAG